SGTFEVSIQRARNLSTDHGASGSAPAARRTSGAVSTGLTARSGRAADGVGDDQDDDGPDDRDDDAPEVEAGDADAAERAEQPAADHRADDAEHDVENESRALPVHDLAGDEAGDQPEDDPGDDGHDLVPFPKPHV